MSGIAPPDLENLLPAVLPTDAASLWPRSQSILAPAFSGETVPRITAVAAVAADFVGEWLGADCEEELLDPAADDDAFTKSACETVAAFCRAAFVMGAWFAMREKDGLS